MGATIDEYCPDGNVQGGRKSGDMWAPTATSSNSWVQVGTHGSCQTCKFYCSNDSPLAAPGWSTGHEDLAYRNWILCVAATATTTTTTTTQVPTSSPTPAPFQWIQNGGSFSWQDALSVCHNKLGNGFRLATIDEYCPDGNVQGGRKSGDMWAPTATSSNSWVQVGTHGSCQTCKFYCNSDSPLAAPGWSTGHEDLAYRNWILCVAATATTTTTTTTQVPTSSPTPAPFQWIQNGGSFSW